MNRRQLERFITEAEDAELNELWLDLDRAITERGARREIIENPKLLMFADIFDESMELLENRKSISGIQTGFGQFDQTTGGFDKGEFIVVFGAAGRGKTMFLQNIMHNFALAGHKSLIVSVEMQNQEMGKRLLEMHSFRQDYESARNLPIAWYPAGLPYSRQAFEEYFRFAVDNGVEMIMLDHIGLLPDLKPERRESYAAWTSFLARQAKELSVPIALIQHTVKLQADAQEPQLRDIAETSTTENNVDMAVAVWQEQNNREVLVRVKKNRLKGRVNSEPLVYEKQVPSYKLIEKSTALEARRLFGGS